MPKRRPPKKLIVDIESEIEKALIQLAGSVQIIGPISTKTHIYYQVDGLVKTRANIDSLCWCLLGFLGDIYRIDLAIDSDIGQGSDAQHNLLNALKHRLNISRNLTVKEKRLNRYPLLQELIAHIFVLINKKQHELGHANPLFNDWLGQAVGLKHPHLSSNETGIDLIALGQFPSGMYPIIGEVKAYKNDPWGGLSKACEKFDQVKRGEYDDEIRTALRPLKAKNLVTSNELAKNIWISVGRFGAVVGHDTNCIISSPQDSTAEIVKNLAKSATGRLFFICTPYKSFDKFLDKLVTRMKALAKSLS